MNIFENNCGSEVHVIGLSDTGEKIPAASGRISTQEGNALEILEKSQDEQKNAKLINKVTQSGHNSTIEHTFFNLAFKDVSIFVEQFIIEFRLASFTVKSRRYVDFSNSGYYVPELKTDENKKLFCETVDKIVDSYKRLLDLGIAKEDARFVLPYCVRSNFFCSVNARELLHILSAMIFGRGKKYPEIYNLGMQLRSQVEELTPGILSDFEPRHKDETHDEIVLPDFDVKSTDNNKCLEKTTLLSYSPNPERTVAEAALMTDGRYSSGQIEKILSDKENIDKIVCSVMKSSRPRPLETINFTFSIHNVSLSTVTHFARHRMQSLIVPPLKNTDRKKYIIPLSVKENDAASSIYLNCFALINELYSVLLSRGLSSEELVYCQLSGNTIDLNLTMNGRELKLFMALRTCNRAQWEVREYAIDILKKLRDISPLIFVNYGPGCYTSKCPEGRMSCGKAEKTIKYFTEI